MRYWFGIFVCTTILGACGGALITESYMPPKPVPVIVGEPSLTVFAHRFQQDCIRFLSKQKCNLPHKISLKYFPYKKHPDRRGYAELWGRKDVIQWADVQIADYLQSSVYKESLLVTVYHELFHAWFDLDHTEDGISIMNSVAYYDVDLLIENDFDFYLSKEFERVKYKH